MFKIPKVIRTFFSCCFMQLILLQPLTATWTPPIQVSPTGFPNRVGTVDGAVLDTNALNNGVAIWSLGSESSILSSFYTFGQGWSSPVIISSLALIPGLENQIFISQGDPQITMNNNNYCVGVWEASEFIVGPNFDYQGVYAAERNPDGTWTSVQRVSALNVVDPNFFAANICGAVNDSGLAVAAWTESRADDTVNILDYVMASFLTPGGSWSTPVAIVGPVAPNFRNQEFTPDVQIDAHGNVIVAWKLGIGAGSLFTIGATTYSAATNTWSPPITLDPGGNFDLGAGTDLPKAAMNESDNGNGIVVWNWKDVSGSTFRVYASSFTNGVWGPAIIVDERTDGDLSNANVIMDSFGNATAIWTFSGSVTEVYSSSLPFGGVWSAPVVISTIAGSNFIDVGLVQRPISVNTTGDVIAIFGNETGTSTNVFSVTKPFGAAWLLPEFITGDTTYPPNQRNPTLLNIGIGSCGFALSLWEARNLTGNFQVWSSVHSTGLVAPCNFTGTQCQEKLATQSVCINTLTWDNCSPGCALSFNLYRNGVLIATIPGSGPFTFIDPVKCKNQNTYCLTSVDALGVESPSACIVLP